ncbi:MAG: hypothetical protein WKF79_06320 [Nocardioides sp.]
MSPVPGLQDKVQEVIEAAIKADLHENTSFYGSCAEGFTGPGLPTEANSMPPDVRVTYPSGEVFVYGDIPASDIQPLFDLKAMFETWDRIIKQAFDRWLELPEPSSFDGRLATLQAVAAGLAVSGVTVNESGSETEVEVGNSDLETWVADIQAEMNDYEGIAFEVLNDSYLSRLDNVLSGQHAIATVLGVAIASEQEVWKRAREDILHLAEEARKAFEEVASGGGGTLKGSLSIFGAFLGAIGVFATGGAALVVGSLGAATGIVTSFMPDAQEPPEIELGGVDVVDVHGNMLSAVSEANRTLGGEEQTAYLTIMSVMDTVQARLDSFDFGTPVDFLGENRPGELYAPAENVILLMDGLREVAAKVKVISTTLATVNGDLAGVVGSTPWERDAILGYGGHIGYYRTWEQLHSMLTNVLQRSSVALGELAARMILVANDFQRTEEQIEADLLALTRDLPDPTPRDQVPYGFQSGWTGPLPLDGRDESAAPKRAS